MQRGPGDTSAPPPSTAGGQSGALARAYRQALPAKLRAIEVALASVREATRAGAPCAAEALRHATVLVHRLAGSAGSFGLEAVGDAAGVLEVVLLVEPGGTAAVDSAAALGAVEHLRAAVAAAAEPDRGV